MPGNIEPGKVQIPGLFRQSMRVGVLLLTPALIARWGFLADFMSRTVLVGFLTEVQFDRSKLTELFGRDNICRRNDRRLFNKILVKVL